MNDLAFKLKEDGSKLTAEEFMNEVERVYDGRSKEFASLDNIDNLIDKLDKYIKDNQGVLYGGIPIAAAAKAVSAGLKVFKNVYQKTKSFVKAKVAFINEIFKKLNGLLSSNRT